jgi:hypothetical protein
MEYAVQNLSNAIAHAMYEGFPLIEYEDRDWEHFGKTGENKRVTKTRKHSDRDIEVYAMFSQTWSSTALGFGGLGGQAITSAYTIVLRSNYLGEYCVYFGGRFAYHIKRINQKFIEDVMNREMCSVKNKGKYEQGVE